MVKIGALWKKQDRNDNPMFSGEFECPHCKEKSRILGFLNKYKKPENRQPDWNLFVPEDKPKSQEQVEKDEPYMPEEGKSNDEDERAMPF